MDFYAVLDQVVALLRQRQRLTYRALKVQFQLDDEALEALRDELIEAQHLAADEAGKVLVWTGDAGSSLAPAQEPVRAPYAYTPPYLAEKILTSAVPWQASASRSRCCLLTSKARWSCSPTATRRRPASSSTRSWST